MCIIRSDSEQMTGISIINRVEKEMKTEKKQEQDGYRSEKKEEIVKIYLETKSYLIV